MGSWGETFATSTLQERKLKAQVSSLPNQRGVTEFLQQRNLGLSQSIMVQEGAHNPNATLKGYPKKCWGLFGQKAHKTQLIALFQPQNGGLSLTLVSNRHLNTNPSGHPMKLWGLVGMVVHTTQQIF